MGKNRIQPIIPNTKLRSSISAPNAFPKIGHIMFTENGVPNKAFTPTPSTPPIITLTITGLGGINKSYDGTDVGYLGGIPTLDGVLPEDIGLVNIEADPDPFIAGAQFVNIGPGNNIGCYVNDSFILTGPSAGKYYFDPYAITGYANIFW